MKLFLFFLYFLIVLKLIDTKVHICNFENVVQEVTTIAIRKELEQKTLIKKQQKKTREEEEEEEEEIRRLYTEEGYRIDSTNIHFRKQNSPILLPLNEKTGEINEEEAKEEENEEEEEENDEEENEEKEKIKVRKNKEPVIIIDIQNTCEINAKGFDIIEYFCPFEKKPQCFQKISLQESSDMPQASFGELRDFYLTGSILLPIEKNIDKILISPITQENKIFYCFCNLLEDKNSMKKYIRRLKGTMKVVIKKSSGKIKGCHFGMKNSEIFTKTLLAQDEKSSKVCEIKAYPGELVGFQFIYDNTGTVYPKNCFENVLNNGQKVPLSSLLPSFISYNNKQNILTDPFYLQLPHFINQSHVIECVSKSSTELFSNYIFRLIIHRGTSNIINRSFQKNV